MAASMEGNDGDPNLTPLLDVVLQLIMFFMITVNFVSTENLPENIILPVAQTAVPLEQAREAEVYLNVDKDGKLVGSEVEDLNTLEKLKAHLTRRKEYIEREARAKGQTGETRIVVIIRAHQDARYFQVWDVLNSCQKAGFKNWQIRAMTQAP
jgi:biopolymer transport protein ExbD